MTISSFYTPEFFRLVYRYGHHTRKAFSFVTFALRRLASCSALAGTTWSSCIAKPSPWDPRLSNRSSPRGIPLVYDFDDAIFLPNVSEANRAFGFLKNPSRVARILQRSTHVVVGNEFLADFARRHNPAVTVIPTVVDTDRFVPRATGTDSHSCRVGWIGSPTTLPYLRDLGDPPPRGVGASLCPEGQRRRPSRGAGRVPRGGSAMEPGG